MSMRAPGVDRCGCLAVTHEASRTGAVLAFLEALPVLRDLGTELVVVNKAPGPLSPRLRSSADRLLETPRPLLSQGRRIARVQSLDRFVPRIERTIAHSVVRGSVRTSSTPARS